MQIKAASKVNASSAKNGWAVMSRRSLAALDLTRDPKTKFVRGDYGRDSPCRLWTPPVSTPVSYPSSAVRHQRL